MRFLAILLVCVWLGAGLVMRDVADRSNKREAYAVVYELGGVVRSLPGWPFGDEIIVRFRGSSRHATSWTGCRF